MAELACLLRASLQLIWRATLRRGRLPIASGRNRSALLPSTPFGYGRGPRQARKLSRSNSARLDAGAVVGRGERWRGTPEEKKDQAHKGKKTNRQGQENKKGPRRYAVVMLFREPVMHKAVTWVAVCVIRCRCTRSTAIHAAETFEVTGTQRANVSAHRKIASSSRTWQKAIFMLATCARPGKVKSRRKRRCLVGRGTLRGCFMPVVTIVLSFADHFAPHSSHSFGSIAGRH
jgi:hypothetical protein